MKLYKYIVACQAHPALVKIGPALVQFCSPYTKGLTDSSEDWRFVGDPAPLARDNIYVITTMYRYKRQYFSADY